MVGRSIAFLRIRALSACLAILGGCTNGPESEPDFSVTSVSSLG